MSPRLKRDDLELDRKYLGSLLTDIYVERMKRIDTMTLNAAFPRFSHLPTSQFDETARKYINLKPNDPVNFPC